MNVKGVISESKRVVAALHELPRQGERDFIAVAREVNHPGLGAIDGCVGRNGRSYFCRVMTGSCFVGVTHGKIGRTVHGKVLIFLRSQKLPNMENFTHDRPNRGPADTTQIHNARIGNIRD